jgi:hypothetical protein
MNMPFEGGWIWKIGRERRTREIERKNQRKKEKMKL